MKKNHGITLIALVITIVVLLILAGITIVYVFGDNGIFKQASDAKTKTEIGKLRERIDVIQVVWYTDKKLDPTVTLDDFWERLIDDNIITSKEDIEGPEKEGENDVYLLDTTEGYIVEVIITPDENIIIGEIIKGKNLPPKITSIEVLNKTSNSIEVKVEVSRLEDGKLSYYYKKESETEYHELKDKIKVTDLTATYTGIEQNQAYNIKVVVENKRGKGEKIINVLTGELEQGIISQKGETVWNNYKASIELETTNTNLTLKYQINGIDGTWQPYNGTIGNLNHDDTVYAVLTDGTNYGEVATIVIRDGTAPNDATISLATTTTNTGANVTATVTHNDAQSGPKITSCKWVYNTTAGKIGTDASNYTGGTFSSNGQTINLNASTLGTYYLHVLTTDNGNNVWETVSSAITVSQLATGVTVSPTTATIEEGETKQLTATVTPTNTSNKGVTWTSSDASVATVNNSGVVTGLSKGTVTITVKTTDGSGVKATCNISVIDAIDKLWAEIAEMAKEIANDDSITNDSTEATVTVNGESKTIKVGEFYNVKYNGEKRRVRVLGFKHDDLVNTGVYGGNHSKAGISFEFYDFMTGSTYMQMNTSNTNSGGWASTKMRSDLNGSGSSIGGLGANLSNKEYIKQVKKKYIATYNSASSVTTSNDYLWLLAASEVVKDGYQSGYYAYAITSEGSQYKYYQGVTEAWSANSTNRVKYNAAGGAMHWWLRSPYYGRTTYFCIVHSTGYTSGITNASIGNGVAPGFCI